MQARLHAVGIGVLGLASSLAASTSEAHIDLLAPQPRMSGAPSTYLDSRPCGQRNPGRTEDRVTVFRPGETIQVVWDAYVQHPSYFRLSFDLEGDDSFSERGANPSDPARDDPTSLPPGEGELILDYVQDLRGELEHVEHPVTLPSEPCSDCTLQLLQFIYDLPLADATYYQCADLVLEGEPIVLQPADTAATSAEVDAATRTESAAPSHAGCALAGAAPTAQGSWWVVALSVLLAWGSVAAGGRPSTRRSHSSSRNAPAASPRPASQLENAESHP